MNFQLPQITADEGSSAWFEQMERRSRPTFGQFAEVLLTNIEAINKACVFLGIPKEEVLAEMARTLGIKQ